jgi:DNA-binding LacI/PurR family transcriptional regulator
VDNKGAVKDAVNRLITAGHREIGIIAGPEEMYTAQERLYGYEQALAKARIPIRDSLMVRGDYTIRGGMKAMRELIQKNTDLSAVLVSNYEMTLGSVIELHELGVQIPEELSLIGFDNVEFARASTPRLSIVTQPTKEIGKKAAELMLLRLQEDTVSGKKQKLRLKTGFVEGNSVRDIKREESLERTKE